MRMYLFLLFCLISCKSGEKLIWGANKNKNFSSLNEYKSCIFEKYKFDQKKIYCAEQKDYNAFLYYIADRRMDYFLGTFKNDSTEYKKSDFLADYESCAGRIEREIDLIGNSTISNTIRNDFFLSHKFQNINTNEALNLSKPETHKIILVVSYKLGRIHKSDFEKIEKLVSQKTGFELIILSLDPVFDYK